ncbi:MAG: hypothetical protein Q8K05_08800 [Polaromonas sp.]|uniref:hypothetical protein n=1 Tax=Polaromonas sp. TaxID=1869339 RepID=UPI002730EF0D|nr:hypothetical protein [Polaromonas sp.]MDP2256139.1 hypothetical protein [Polaromonas sp.]
MTTSLKSVFFDAALGVSWQRRSFFVRWAVATSTTAAPSQADYAGTHEKLFS